MTANVSVIILTYNSERHLPALFESIKRQTLQPHEVIVVDNASHDGTVTWLKEQTIIPVQLICNTVNLWFAQGNNQGIVRSTGDYVYVCNDDIMLSPTALERLVWRMEQSGRIAMVGGKMLKLIHGKPSHVIDSAGITLHRSGRAVNRGEQEADTGQYNEAEEVFGITGAGMLLRRTALEQIKHGPDEYFDRDFVAYKEDVDLSWRCHRAGWQVWYEPSAVIYHARTIQHTSLAGRSNKSKRIRAMSYRNHLWMLIKNLTTVELLRRLPWLLPYECAKLAYACLSEWSTLRMLPETISGFKRQRRKQLQHL